MKADSFMFTLYLVGSKNDLWGKFQRNESTRHIVGSGQTSGWSGRDEIFQPELFESSENMKQTRLDIRVTRPTLPDSANPGF